MSASIGSIGNPYLTVVTGIVVLISPVLIARLIGLAGGLVFPISGTLSFLGFLLEYLALDGGIRRRRPAQIRASRRDGADCRRS